MRYLAVVFLALMVLLSCDSPPEHTTTTVIDTAKQGLPPLKDGEQISTGKVTPAELVTFARTLTGVPYKYASTDPKEGFDCSGFITYVFNHFGIAVPRQSVSFTNVKREIDLREARPGDLVLFTGTDSTVRVVGHMGIVVSLPGQQVSFIHSTSGHAYGVTESALQPYYMSRYVKTVRIFP